MAASQETGDRVFSVNGRMLKRLRIDAGLTIDEFANQAVMRKDTALKLFRGGPSPLSVVTKAAKALGVERATDLLAPDERAELGLGTDAVDLPLDVLEWRVESFLGPWSTAPNGVQMQVAKLAHRYLPGRFARGKRYELGHLSLDDRRRREAHLQRHAVVCAAVRNQHVAENITAVMVEATRHWWVLDHWFDGEPLMSVAERGPLSPGDLRKAMGGTAAGLLALHEAQIVRRDLSPASILLDDGCRALLTDFELAKLLDGRPTVRPEKDWPSTPFLAPEVVAGTAATKASDTYSFARSFLFAATGEGPQVGAEPAILQNLGLPGDVQRTLLAYLEPAPSRRLDDLAPMIRALKAWKA